MMILKDLTNILFSWKGADKTPMPFSKEKMEGEKDEGIWAAMGVVNAFFVNKTNGESEKDLFTLDRLGSFFRAVILLIHTKRINCYQAYEIVKVICG